jgi:hypothetical protein
MGGWVRGRTEGGGNEASSSSMEITDSEKDDNYGKACSPKKRPTKEFL